MPASKTATQPIRQTPVVILNGFLGSGKTTVLRNLLEPVLPRTQRTVGVIVNEMSSLDIDGELIADTDYFEGHEKHFCPRSVMLS